MFAEPDRTQYDLKFRLFGFPVRIHPWFWVGAAILGASWLDQPGGTIFILVWVASVLVSILVHELGHAIAFRCFGIDSHIVLYVFGGLAVPWRDVPRSWQRLLVALAGPIAGFVLCAIVYFSDDIHPWSGTNRYAGMAYTSLFFINLVWGLFNLLPVFPLDGGQVTKEICFFFNRRNSMRTALIISITVAACVSAYSLACVVESRQRANFLGDIPYWARGNLWSAILFAVLAVQNYQLLQHLSWTESHWDHRSDRSPWSR